MSGQCPHCGREVEVSVSKQHGVVTVKGACRHFKEVVEENNQPRPTFVK